MTLIAGELVVRLIVQMWALDHQEILVGVRVLVDSLLLLETRLHIHRSPTGLSLGSAWPAGSLSWYLLLLRYIN